MGLDRAKSLLEVRDGLSFLDIIVQQVLGARKEHGVALPLLFMNSFRTREDTLAVLERYPDLAVDDLPLYFLQNKEPKLRADDLTPVEWERDCRWSGIRRARRHRHRAAAGCSPPRGRVHLCVRRTPITGAVPDARGRVVRASGAVRDRGGPLLPRPQGRPLRPRRATAPCCGDSAD
jgi:hypothetical protein